MEKRIGPDQRMTLRRARSGWCVEVRCLLCLIAAMALSGCTIAIVSGPSTVAAGESVTYVSTVGAGEGDVNILLFFQADVPLGWQLESAFFEGTLHGVPTVLEAIETDRGCGPIAPGLQRYAFEAGPFPLTVATDTGTATLTFHVEDQPPVEYKIYFRFGAVGENGGGCSSPAVRTINRQGSSFLRFYEAHFIEGNDGGSFGGDIAAAADGRQVYVGVAELDSLAVFDRDPVSGGLTPAGILVDDTDGVDGIDHIQSIAVAPDGRDVYAVAFHDSSIAAFARDPRTGQLTFTEALFDGVNGVEGLQEARGVAISPDGLHVYAVTDNSLAAFGRDQVTGELEFLQALFHVPDGVEGLSGSNALAISPDGLYLYVTADGNSSMNNTLATFARDPATGELSFFQVLRSDDEGIAGLGGARAVAVAPDGGHVYVASRFGDFDHVGGLAVFARDPVTSELSFIQVLYNSIDVPGLETPRGVAVSPDGGHVLFTGVNSAVVFVRQLESGLLTFLEAQFEGDPPEQIGLEGALGLTVVAGPRGDHVYVTSELEHAVAVLRTASAIFADGFESGDTSRWSNVSP